MEDFKPKTVNDSDSSEQLTSSLPARKKLKSGWGLVLACFIAGIVGGLYGSLDLSQRSFFQKYLSGQSDNTESVQTVKVEEESATIDVVKKASPAVVSIVISKDISQMRRFMFDPFGNFPSSNESAEPNIQEVGAGTGFFVSKDGLIITNKHVVADEGAAYTVVTSDGKSYEAKVLSQDPVNDIAIIKIEIENAPYLSFAESSDLQLGQKVIAIGNSLGQYQNTVTSGVISGVGRSITAGGAGELEQLEGVIQTDAAINSGNSGGPLLNLAGLVVGINTAVDRQGQSIGFAIPANDVKVALESYQDKGKITRPYLGVRYLTINPAIAKSEKLPKDYGALLIRGESLTDFAVLPGSPADKAGLRENDIILEFAGKRVDENNSLSKILKQSRPGDRVDLKVYRAGEEITVSLTIGENE